MELKETVTLMNSADYKERFMAEYLQLKIRYEKLKTFCNRIEGVIVHNNALPEDAPNRWIEPRHDCPLSTLREQQALMGQLLHILEVRAVIEHINLNFDYSIKEDVVEETTE